MEDIYCETEAEAKVLMDILTAKGIFWADGGTPNTKTHWDDRSYDCSGGVVYVIQGGRLYFFYRNDQNKLPWLVYRTFSEYVNKLEHEERKTEEISKWLL